MPPLKDKGDLAELLVAADLRARGYRVIQVRCRTHSLTNGRVRATKQYTAQDVDWIAVYDPTSGGIFYVSASELADGRSILHLRLDAPRNGQRAGIRDASDYLSI